MPTAWRRSGVDRRSAVALRRRYLVHAADELGEPDAVLTPLFGRSQAELVAHARKLGALQRTAQGARLDAH
jgi:hypothetical protein